MKMAARIIFYIGIVLFTMFLASASSISEQDANALSMENVSEAVLDGFFVKLYKRDAKLPNSKDASHSFLVKEGNANAQQTQARPGSKNGSSTHDPEFSPMSENGTCLPPNICKSDEYWAEHFCDKLLFCIIIASNGSLNGSSSNGRAMVVENIENGTINCVTELPDCNPKCRDQVSHIFANSIRLRDMTYYVVPIPSPCNRMTSFGGFPEKYGYALGGGLGILLTTMLISILCIVKRKKRTVNSGGDAPSENKHSDHMVENMLYS